MHPPTSGLRTRMRRAEGGAAAVEFALVAGILFLIVFGIIQYGFYFSDTLSTRQGVREGARQAVVENFDFRPGCASGSTSEQLRCAVAKEIGAISGTPKIKVVATPWERGKSVKVCAAVKSDGVIGLLPMPSGGWITSKTEMYIEQESDKDDWTDSQDSLPSGMSWSWC